MPQCLTNVSASCCEVIISDSAPAKFHAPECAWPSSCNFLLSNKYAPAASSACSQPAAGLSCNTIFSPEIIPRTTSGITRPSAQSPPPIKPSVRAVATAVFEVVKNDSMYAEVASSAPAKLEEQGSDESRVSSLS